jgi:hypothetical protein
MVSIIQNQGIVSEWFRSISRVERLRKTDLA